MPARQLRWLLIGNSRWHWALDGADGGGGDAPLRFLHLPPPTAVGDPPLAWAAVGPVPPQAGLPAATRLELKNVPLAEVPPWLGIDRALAGWWAARLTGGPVLVADAGTVLSLTRVDGRGRFAGGRLMAGAALQLGAMASGTQGLPSLEEGLSAGGGGDAWPKATDAAMRRGVAEGLAAAVLEAGRQARALEPGCRIVLTGGDGPTLMPLLQHASELGEGVLMHCPDLCLEALVALRPRPPVGGVAQASPRSSRI
ncbi:type III pantothenate kinase [Synechococcus sp. CS-1332]|uniref:type III pantothenate kinase n=1 Tax=Synechococcus sp. CS-1332 TaxID=2847972 RepID=UPI00223B8C06|nr:type III pantothenate kinase [Synechococcus sp. CS-1332]MCT0208363.1 type III pantothenate kinase [Synechococcus sp. CS-1332]